MARKFLEVKWDTSEFDKMIKELEGEVPKVEKRALMEMGDELLRLSSREVPHDTGFLQSTGVSQPSGKDWEVGYHTRYAARLHEHPEYKFQKGRKGKYLEDPLKNNMSKWIKVYQEEISRMLGK
jgi:hypothetical protein